MELCFHFVPFLWAFPEEQKSGGILLAHSSAKMRLLMLLLLLRDTLSVPHSITVERILK